MLNYLYNVIFLDKSKLPEILDDWLYDLEQDFKFRKTPNARHVVKLHQRVSKVKFNVERRLDSIGRHYESTCYSREYDREWKSFNY